MSILELYRAQGHRRYAGEPVTQLAHARQCGEHARRAGAGPALELAAWLHDVGHLLGSLGTPHATPTLAGIDDRHERIGAAVLARIWGPAVAGPVALHVDAKRCLVGQQPAYHHTLSADSQRSLALQGGPLSPLEQRRFLAHPHAHAALRLRLWDDLAKKPVNGSEAGGAPAAADDERALQLLEAAMARVPLRRRAMPA